MTWLGIDADDTLWRNEDFFRATEDAFYDVVTSHVDIGAPAIHTALRRIEARTIPLYGYGAKGFTLTMVECALEVSDSAISPSALREIIDLGTELLQAPVEVLDGVDDALTDLGSDHRLLLITKGDLAHQRAKTTSSGLTHHFEAVHVLAEKDPASYAEVLDRHDIDAADFVMVGNSVRSDILPVLELGGRAIHVPYHLTWAAEVVDDPDVDFPVVDELAAVRAHL